MHADDCTCPQINFFFVVNNAVIGAVVLALSSLMGIWWLYKLVKKWQKTELKRKFFKRNGGLLLQQELRAAEGWVQKTTCDYKHTAR
jgi:hypothetical protein